MLKTGRCARVQGRFPAAPRQCPQIMQTRGKFMDVIARSEATRQSVLFAAAQNEKQHLGRIRSSLRIRLKCYFSLPFSAGTRIATPVCALVRNDMQKEGRVRGGKNVARNDMQKIAALLRVQEGAAGASPQPPTNSPQFHPFAPAKAPLPSAFHRAPRPCTRRRVSVFCMSLRTSAHTGVAIRFSCGST